MGFADNGMPGSRDFSDRKAARVKFEGMDAVEGLVCWVDGFVAGVEFVRPIHQAVFDALVPRVR